MRSNSNPRKDGARIFMTQELAGFPLQMQERPLQSTYSLVNQLGQSVALAHQRGVTHGDLNFDNLIVSTEGMLKTYLYGAACSLHNPDYRLGRAETPYDLVSKQHASCEVLSGEQPTKTDDVYSAGVLIYELVSGRHPYDGHSATEALATGIVPSPIDSIDAGAWQHINEMISLNRENRPKTMEEIFSPASLQSNSNDRVLLRA